MLTIATASSAQTFGVKAALNFATMTVKDNDETYSDVYTMRPGFQIGATAEMPIAKKLSFETGLLLSSKGFKYDFQDVKSKMSLLYAEIPLTLKVSFPINAVGSLYGVFGPFIGIGLTGKTKGETETTDVSWGNDKEKNDLKRLDFGLTVAFGGEIKSMITYGMFGSFGLANISPNTDNGSKISNRVVGIFMGYKFGKK